MNDPASGFVTSTGQYPTMESSAPVGSQNHIAPVSNDWMYWSMPPPPPPPPPPPTTTPPPPPPPLHSPGSGYSSQAQFSLGAQPLPEAPPPFDAQILPGAQPPFDTQSPQDCHPQLNGQPDWNFQSSTSWYWRQSPDVPTWHQQSHNTRVHRPYFPQNHGAEFTAFNSPGRKRKRKNRKEPDYQYFCDTCDRGFKTQDKYDIHMSEHTKCPEADCSFTAHEKIVQFHWRNMHAPGMKKIKLDTPEEIAKWREERKKNYPTLENIERKKKLKLEKEKCGAVLTTTQYGKMRGMSRLSQMAMIRSPSKHHKWKNDCVEENAISGPESEKEKKSQSTVTPKEVTEALSSLMSSYSNLSGSESEPDEAPIKTEADILAEEQVLQSSTPTTPSQDVKIIVKNVSEVQCERRKKHFKHSNSKKKKSHQNNHTLFKPRTHHPNLLEMLLAPDIRHERNVILQCVRYIIKKDFFGLNNSEKTKDVHIVDVPVHG